MSAPNARQLPAKAPRLRRWASIACVALLAAPALAACVGPRDPADRFAPGPAARVFRAGYESIAERYVEDVPVGTLAVEGLRGLSTLDSDITITRTGGVVELLRSGAIVARFETPGERDPDGWAELTVAALAKACAASSDLDAAPVERIYKAVFEGIVSGLDEFSRYAGLDQASRERASREGFGGVGIRFAIEADGAVVTSVVVDTPADRAGLRTGDRIVAIDDVPTAGLDHREMARQLHGRVDSRLDLTVERPGRDTPMTLSLARALIIPQTVVANRERDVAYVQLTGFNQRTAGSLSRAVGELAEDGGVAGVVLDLRGNPGGLLDQAVAVADLFLTRGEIISTRGRHPDSNQRFAATGEDLAEGLPLVVLVNGESASAAEIVAAALQDHRRALVVGTASYGKGTVQNVIHLPNGGELTLTWSRIHAPSGYALDRLGVMPTVCTSGPEASGPALIGDLRSGWLESAAMLARWRGMRFADDEASEELREACPARDGTPEVDLEVARQLLEKPGLYARGVQLSFPEVATR